MYMRYLLIFEFLHPKLAEVAIETIRATLFKVLREY